MWVSSGQMTLFFGQTLLFGILAGAFYDLFRILRIAFRLRKKKRRLFLRVGKWLSCFLQDMIYWLILAVFYSIFIYRMAGGRLRLMSVFALACGFAVWYFTFGRLVIFLAERIISFVRAVLRLVLSVTIFPIGRALRFCLGRPISLFVFVFALLYNAWARHRELSLASKGMKIKK